MKCALCNKEADLMNSHLIPKLVYNRIKSHPKSRFRSLDNITRVMQDGEKHYMLCHECEEKFSALETYFAKEFLDVYLNTETIPVSSNQQMTDDYILSVAWRVLWDDLYRVNSYNDSDFIRSEFEFFEKELRNYLLNGAKRHYIHFINRIYKVSELVSNLQGLDEGTIFGYTYYPNAEIGCLIIVYYAGLVYVTEMKNDRKVLVGFNSNKSNLVSVLSEEIATEFKLLIRQYKDNMTPELKEKIQKFYNK